MFFMNQDFIDRLRQRAPEAFKGEPVVFAYLYGSAATGRQHARSDIDIAVYLDATVPTDRYLDVSLDLAGRLSDGLGIGNIEVLILNAAPLTLLGSVLKERKVVYSVDEPSRVKFESRSFRVFVDFDFHARFMDQKFLRDTAKGRR